MASSASGSKKFLIEGVIINIPHQPKAIRVKRLPLHIIMPKQMLHPGFRPFRFVANLKMVEALNPRKAVTVFKPPIEIRVRYTAADYKAAMSDGGSLKLGYWDGAAWTLCTAKIVSKRSADKGGWLVTSITKWDDPTLAVGS